MFADPARSTLRRRRSVAVSAPCPLPVPLLPIAPRDRPGCARGAIERPSSGGVVDGSVKANGTAVEPTVSRPSAAEAGAADSAVAPAPMPPLLPRGTVEDSGDTDTDIDVDGADAAGTGPPPSVRGVFGGPTMSGGDTQPLCRPPVVAPLPPLPTPAPALLPCPNCGLCCGTTLLPVAMGWNDGLPLMLLPCPRRCSMVGASHSSSGSKNALLVRGWWSRPRLNTRPSIVVTVVCDAPADAHTTRSPPRCMEQTCCV